MLIYFLLFIPLCFGCETRLNCAMTQVCINGTCLDGIVTILNQSDIALYDEYDDFRELRLFGSGSNETWEMSGFSADKIVLRDVRVKIVGYTGSSVEIDAIDSTLVDSFNDGNIENVIMDLNDMMVFINSFASSTNNVRVFIKRGSSSQSPVIIFKESFNVAKFLDLTRSPDSVDVFFRFDNSFQNLARFQSLFGSFYVGIIKSSFQNLKILEVRNSQNPLEDITKLEIYCSGVCSIIDSFNGHSIISSKPNRDLSLEIYGASVIRGSFNNFDFYLKLGSIHITDTLFRITAIDDSFNPSVRPNNVLDLVKISDCRELNTIRSSFKGIMNITNVFLENLPSLNLVVQSFGALQYVATLSIKSTRMPSLVVFQDITEMFIPSSIILEDNQFLTGIDFPNVRRLDNLFLKNNLVMTNAVFGSLEKVNNMNIFFNGLNSLSFPVLDDCGTFSLVDHKFRNDEQLHFPVLRKITEISIINNRELESLMFLKSVNFGPGPRQGKVNIIGNKIRCEEIPDNFNQRNESISCCGDEILDIYNNEFCDNSTSCKPSCEECSENSFGERCVKCSCLNGVCDSGKYGTGTCLVCDTNYFGPDCMKNCTCEKGICNSGINGDGKCLTCFTKYYSIDTDCSQYCFCGDGDCDERTGICSKCNEGYFGTNCRVPVQPDRPISPILNCVEFNSDMSSYQAYLGYSNIDDENVEILSSTFYCGDESQELVISGELSPGQNNFEWRVQNCTADIIWKLNGMELLVRLEDARKMSCSRTNQQFVFTLDGEDMSESQLQELKLRLSESSSINANRINVEKISPASGKRQSETEIRVFVTSEASDDDAQELILDVTSGNINLENTLSDIGIESSIELNTHTFNETVGTTIILTDDAATPSSTDEINGTPNSESDNSTLIVVIIICAAGMTLILSAIIITINPISSAFCAVDR